MEAYDRLVHLVNDIAEEVSKAEGGNKAAGEAGIAAASAVAFKNLLKSYALPDPWQWLLDGTLPDDPKL